MSYSTLFFFFLRYIFFHICFDLISISFPFISLILLLSPLRIILIHRYLDHEFRQTSQNYCDRLAFLRLKGFRVITQCQNSKLRDMQGLRRLPNVGYHDISGRDVYRLLQKKKKKIPIFQKYIFSIFHSRKLNSDPRNALQLRLLVYCQFYDSLPLHPRHYSVNPTKIPSFTSTTRSGQGSRALCSHRIQPFVGNKYRMTRRRLGDPIN